MWWWIGSMAWGQELICVEVVCDHAAIQDALLSAPTDGTLTVFVVLGGTYVEDGLVVGPGQHVVLEALGAVTVRADTDTSTFTVLDGGRLELDGITLSALNGRGVRVNEGHLALRNAVVFPLGVVGEGAGIWATGGTLEVTDTLFLDSVAASNGGHISATDATLTVARTQFLGGTAAEGGSIYLSGTMPQTATFTEAKFEGNLATRRGGALMVEGTVILDVVGGSFEDNFARDGGALALAETAGTTVHLSGTRIAFNEASENGGGASTFGGHLDAVGTEWIGNRAGDQGGALFVDLEGSLYLEGSTVCDNDARRGGGIRSSSAVPQVWTNNRIVENVATDGGGGIDLEGEEVQILQHSLLGNDAPLGSGIRGTGPAVLRNNLVAFHGEGAALDFVDDVDLDEGHTATWANTAGDLTDGLIFGAFHQVEDPRLADYRRGGGCEQDDFHSWYGPLVNAGDPNGEGDRDGSRADIGAYGGPRAADRAWSNDLDEDGFPPLYDCVEGDPTYYPDATPGDGETHDTPYDGLDQDCDEGDDFDVDGDGFRWPEDCDDLDAAVFPGAPEPVGGGDRNCDQLVDADGDGVEPPEDCDDGNPRVHPGVVEDGDPTVDRDCDGTGDIVRPLVPMTCSGVTGTPLDRMGSVAWLVVVGLSRRRRLQG